MKVEKNLVYKRKFLNFALFTSLPSLHLSPLFLAVTAFAGGVGHAPCPRRGPGQLHLARPRFRPKPLSSGTSRGCHAPRRPSARHAAERRRRSRRLCPRVARRRPPPPLNPVVAVEVAKFVFASSLSPSLRAEFLGPLLAPPEAPPASMSAAALTSPWSATLRPPSAQPTMRTGSPPPSEAPEPRRHHPGPSAGRRHHCWPPKLRPPSILVFRPFSARLNPAVSFLELSSPFLTSLPLDSGTTAVGTPPRRRSCRAVPPAHAAAASARARAPPPRASGPQDSPGRRPALPRRRLGPSSASQARHAAGHGPGGNGVVAATVVL